MPTLVFRLWLVIATALWLYFGPKTFFDNQDYRETIQQISSIESNQSPPQADMARRNSLPAGAQETRNQYETALERRSTLRERLTTDLIGIAVPLAFLVLFWLASGPMRRR